MTWHPAPADITRELNFELKEQHGDPKWSCIIYYVKPLLPNFIYGGPSMKGAIPSDCMLIICPMPLEPTGFVYDSAMRDIHTTMARIHSAIVVGDMPKPCDIVVAVTVPLRSKMLWQRRMMLSQKVLVLHSGSDDPRSSSSMSPVDRRTLIEVVTKKGPNRVAIMVDPKDDAWSTVRDRIVDMIKKGASAAKWHMHVLEVAPDFSKGWTVTAWAIRQVIEIATTMDTVQDRIGAIVVIVRDSLDIVKKCQGLIAAAKTACPIRTSDCVIVSIAYSGEMPITDNAVVEGALKTTFPGLECETMGIRYTEGSIETMDVVAKTSETLKRIAVRIARTGDDTDAIF